MATSNLSLLELQTKFAQDKARLEQLKAQDTCLLLKKEKRLQILIGIAILAEIKELKNTDIETYNLKFNKLRKTLTTYTRKERDQKFLKEFDLLGDEFNS